MRITTGNLLWPWLVSFVVAAFLSGCAKEDGGGCDHDEQCKGNRICVQGDCVDPSEAGSGGTTGEAGIGGTGGGSGGSGGGSGGDGGSGGSTGGSGGSPSGGSGGESGATGSGSCDDDDDCKLHNDCCTCEAYSTLLGGEPPPFCFMECDVNKCEELGVSGAVCRGGECAPEYEAAGELGCAEPGAPPCPGVLMCCTGIPYPDEGSCETDCNMDSDRAIKQDLRPVDADALLEKLASLEVTEWSYRAEGPAVRHLGPMAQDFRAAFGLGKDDRHISMVDSGGVTMAAIQALHRRILSLQETNSLLQSELRELRRRVERLDRK